MYSVENDPDSKRSQAVDILRKVPLLSVSGLDKVSMNGSTNFKVLVNGRRSSMYSKNFSQEVSRTGEMRAEGWRYNVELDCNINLYPNGYLFFNSSYNSRRIEPNGGVTEAILTITSA